MRITVLSVPGCPHAHIAAERLIRALEGRSATLEIVEIDDPEQAARLGMRGSPTVLVDGVDPFPEPGSPPSLSCRLYRTPDGHTSGAPSLPALRRALATARSRADTGPDFA